MKISARYDWLGTTPDLPKMVALAIELGRLNTDEVPGPKSNPEIIKLAKLAGIEKIYTNDDSAWCAVAHAALAIQAGHVVPFTGYERLRAVSFRKFGKAVDTPLFGDTLVFSRPGGFHVGIYVGEDELCYHVAGGNQGNQYSVVRIPIKRLLEARRPLYTEMPESVQKVYLDQSGIISSNEA